jgi:putative sterol carrier protein
VEETSPEAVFLTTLARRIERNPDRARKIGGVFEFVLDGDGGGTWHLDLNAPMSCAGPASNMNVRIKMKVPDFLDVVNGRLNEVMAFSQGKLKIEGNITMALKLRDVLRPAGW